MHMSPLGWICKSCEAGSSSLFSWKKRGKAGSISALNSQTGVENETDIPHTEEIRADWHTKTKQAGNIDADAA